MTTEPTQALYNRHPTVELRPPWFDFMEIDETVCIDEKIAPLIKAIWDLSIETTACCQDNPEGMVQIQFTTPADASLFVQATKFDLDYIYEFWDFDVAYVPSEIDLDLDFRISVYFPIADYYPILEGVTHNNKFMLTRTDFRQ